MRHEMLTLNEERNVTLECYLQEVTGRAARTPKRPAIVILPGGGYHYCSDREADPVAAAYGHYGFQTFVLRYSVGEHRIWPNPLNDFDQAMALIRDRAEEWGIYPDKIAVIGFSAGGHLAAAAATMSRNRPNAAILAYPAAGADIKNCNLTAPDTTRFVNEDTCPCFLFATRTDELVSVDNTIEFTAALSKANVSFESHIYAYGPHGVSVCNSAVQDMTIPICSRLPRWVGDSVEWLKDVLGDFSAGEMTQPRCGHYFTADCEPTLSAGCTLGYLLKKPQAMELLLPMVRQVTTGMGTPAEALLDCVQKLTLRAVMQFARFPEEVIDRVDAQLRKIPNP